jgi:hypothetical protein
MHDGRDIPGEEAMKCMLFSEFIPIHRDDQQQL